MKKYTLDPGQRNSLMISKSCVYFGSGYVLRNSEGRPS
jgi:hypothetical protein